MIIWVDAQLSPAIAAWISSNFSMTATALRDLGLRDAKDRAIFFAARKESAILITKDSDFLRLLGTRLSPQSHLAHLRQYFKRAAQADFDQHFAAGVVAPTVRAVG